MTIGEGFGAVCVMKSFSEAGRAMVKDSYSA
jgi:hypothetical protein